MVACYPRQIRLRILIPSCSSLINYSIQIEVAQHGPVEALHFQAQRLRLGLHKCREASKLLIHRVLVVGDHLDIRVGEAISTVQVRVQHFVYSELLFILQQQEVRAAKSLVALGD